MKRFLKSGLLMASATGCILSPVAAKGCAVCMGGADSIVAPAMNGAIFLMLGFVGMMLSSAGGFMFYLARKASRTPLTGHPDLSRTPMKEEK